MILETRLGVIDLQGRQVELSDKLRAFVSERVDDEFGLAIDSITMNISLPEEITSAMTRGVARGVEESGFLNNVDDLGRYQQGKAADAMLAAAQNPGGGAMGDMMSAGMGVALGSQMAGQFGGQGGSAPAQAVGPPPLPGAAGFHIDNGGQPAGPYTIAQLQGAASAGQFTGATLVWTQGMPGWVPASTVPALSGLFATPPPIPTTPTA
jgi:hypothetical protein